MVVEVRGQRISESTLVEMVQGIINGDIVRAMAGHKRIMRSGELKALEEGLKEQSGVSVATKSYINGDNYWYLKSQDWADEAYGNAIGGGLAQLSDIAAL